jgi:hypothetical protein
VFSTNFQSTITPGYCIQLATAATSSRRELRRGVGAALARGERRIVVDCGSWEKPDLILLSTLVSCARLCDEEGAEFELANLGGEMRTTLSDLKLSSRLGLAD